MNLKQRFSIIFSLLFSALLGGVLLFVFTMFSDYRQEEFEKRLAQKAETTIKLLLEVKEIDYQLLKIIDRNTIQHLYNEKVIIFDEQMNLIYSSLDDAVLRWAQEDLVYLKQHGTFFRSDKKNEVYGMYYDSHNKDYFALVTAEDKYGKRKLAYLKYLLWAAFGIGTASAWLLSFYLSKRSLAPLDLFGAQIRKISDQNLNVRLPETGGNNEIQALSQSFNQMIARLDESYRKQREFTGNASHELRTPISRITSQLQNLMQDKELSPEVKESLKSIKDDAFQLSDVVMSLLLLSRLENADSASRSFKPLRVDEIIFACASRVKKIYPDLKLYFEILPSSGTDPDLEIQGDDTLLSIVFDNIIKNAYLYSSDNIVRWDVKQEADQLILGFRNSGDNPGPDELPSLFNAFSRGSNSAYKPGSGLGLLIVKRILHFHRAKVNFIVPEKNQNVVLISFKRNIS